jgi:hypothetical protein
VCVNRPFHLATGACGALSDMQSTYCRTTGASCAVWNWNQFATGSGWRSTTRSVQCGELEGEISKGPRRANTYTSGGQFVFPLAFKPQEHCLWGHFRCVCRQVLHRQTCVTHSVRTTKRECAVKTTSSKCDVKCKAGCSLVGMATTPPACNAGWGWTWCLRQLTSLLPLID